MERAPVSVIVPLHGDRANAERARESWAHHQQTGAHERIVADCWFWIGLAESPSRT